MFGDRNVAIALSVIVPCLNEAENLGPLCDRVRAAFASPALRRRGECELVLVDDGSSDGTWDEIQRLSDGSSWLKPARHGSRRGIPAAWRTGLWHASSRLVCTLDADLQYAPEDIPRLWEALERERADFAQGVRRRRDAALMRRVLSSGLNQLLNTLFGMDSRDNKSSFILCERERLAALLDYRGRYHHWQCFVGVAAHARGLKLVEVDTDFTERERGASAFGGVPLAATAEVLLDLLPALKEYRR